MRNNAIKTHEWSLNVVLIEFLWSEVSEKVGSQKLRARVIKILIADCRIIYFHKKRRILSTEQKVCRQRQKNLFIMKNKVEKHNKMSEKKNDIGMRKWSLPTFVCRIFTENRSRQRWQRHNWRRYQFIEDTLWLA